MNGLTTINKGNNSDNLVIALTAKGHKNKETGDLMVNEYHGDMLLLDPDQIHTNIHDMSCDEPLNFTDYISLLVGSGDFNYMTIRVLYVYDIKEVVNPYFIRECVKVSKHMETPSKLSNNYVYTYNCNINDIDDIKRFINESYNITEEKALYTEVYLYSKVEED